jgi:hypothetical protein
MKTQINLNQLMQQTNQLYKVYASTAQLDAMLGESAYLTPDALMSYCQTRLRGLDTQVQAAFAKQKEANADSAVLSSLSSDFQTPSKDLDLTSTSPDPDLGNMTPAQYVERAAEKLETAASKVSDPQAKEALLEAARNLKGEIRAGNKSFQASDFKNMTADAVGKIQQDLNSGTELSMINLQSLMSQRQSAIQMCTNLVQSLGDQCNKIAENVGH